MPGDGHRDSFRIKRLQTHKAAEDNNLLLGLVLVGLAGVGTPGAKLCNVALCTDDRDLRLRALGEGLRVLGSQELRTYDW